MQKLIELIYSETTENWTDRCKEAFEEIYGSTSGRYPDRAKKLVTLRAPTMTSDTGVPFASLDTSFKSRFRSIWRNVLCYFPRNRCSLWYSNGDWDPRFKS